MREPEHRLITNGRDLSDRVARRIEDRLRESPDCLEDRLLLIGYWGRIKLADLAESENAAQTRLASQEVHLLWLIANQPSLELGDGIMGPPFLTTTAVADAWRAAVAAHPDDAQVLWNAAASLYFFNRHVEPSPASAADEVIDLFTRIARLDPARVPRILRLCASALGILENRREFDRALASCAIACGLNVIADVSDEVLFTMTYPMRECARMTGDRDAIAAMREADQGRKDPVSCRACLTAYAARRR